MRKFFWLGFVFLLLGLIFPLSVRAADCYESNVQPGYNACINSSGHNSCGKGADGLDVCCNPGIIVCPPDTAKGKTQDPHQTVGTEYTGITCGTDGEGINTAIGCIPFGDSTKLISFFLGWGMGIAGGIAFLLILFAGFQIMTSRGDPNRLKAGQELLTSAIAGLILLIFSIFILRVIGVDILQIKEISTSTSTQTTGGKQ
ncbi:MAG TPA: pilin [Patescibacteria group bacterium]